MSSTPSEGLLLYSASKKAGLNYVDPQEAPVSDVQIKFVEDSFDKFADQSKKKDYDFTDFLIDLYDKVGGYYGWSYLEFEETPFEIVLRLNKLIDDKMSKIGDGEIINFQYLNTYMAIAKAFGAFKD